MLDYRPDPDMRTPGLITTLDEFVPTAKGYQVAYDTTAHTAHTYSLAANESFPTKLFASRWNSTPGGIVFAATNQKINVYDYTNGFINVSKAGNYNLGGQVFQYGEDATSAFDMCAYGDYAIACNKTTNTQYRNMLDLTIATLFADLTDGITPPPKANCCESVSNFIFLGDCASWSSVTGSPDILAWSGLGSYNVWAVNPTVTQASYAQFNDTPGPITALKKLNDGLVVFKAEAMYYGRYVGAGTNSPIWDFTRISDKIGCAGHRSVVNVDNMLVFAGKDDIYRFDGTRPQSITQGIYETIKAQVMGNGNTSLFVGHDKPKSSVWFSSNTLIYVWNYKENRWGKMSAGTAPIFCSTNVDDFRTKTLSTVTAGVQSFTTSSNHFNLYTLTMEGLSPKNRNTTRAVDASMTLWAMGAPNKLQTLTRLNPIFSRLPSPTTGISVIVSTGKAPVGLGNSQTKTMSADYRFDLLDKAGMTNNFFQAQFNTAQDLEIMDMVPTFIPAGER